MDVGFSFPNISPIIFSIGPVAIRWYSMAYLAGILIAWFLVNKNIKKYKSDVSPKHLEDLVFYVTLGIILGGRLGYVLFYSGAGANPFIKNPLQIFAIWNGGMSLHGGIIGVILAIYFYALKAKVKFLKMTDLVVLYVPIGIFLGRLANFVNDELWGRVTNVPWAIRFPSGGYLPRHPSQLYEAILEGVLMLVILNLAWRSKFVRERSGFLSALFIACYGAFRLFVEQFREPDAQLGFFFGGITMGQMLSVPLVVVGIGVMLWLSRSE